MYLECLEMHRAVHCIGLSDKDAHPYLKCEPVRTNGVDVELGVQRFRRGGKLSLRAAAQLALHRARWAPDHFLLFFVLHRCIEVEAWDLP